MQLTCHSVAVVLTLVQPKQIRINVHKRNNTQIQYKQANSKYKYTYYQNTHTLQNKLEHSISSNTVQGTPNRNSPNTIKYPQYKFTLMCMVLT